MKELQGLWPAGLVAVTVSVLLVAHPAAGKTADLVQYAAQGTIVPLLLVAYLVAERRYGRQALAGVRAMLGIAVLIASAILVVTQLSLVALVLAILQVGVARVWLGAHDGLAARRAPALVIAALLLVTAWTATLTLVWWMPRMGNPLHVITLDAGGSQPASSLALVAIMVLSLGCAVTIAYPRIAAPAVGATRGLRRRWRAWAPVLVACVAFAYAGGQTVGLRDPDVSMSWAFYIGPAELVRQGGWPLWDVPSQYGVLSILLIAWSPLHSPWESLYILNAAANVALALLVFLAVRHRGAGVIDWIGSVLIALAAVFLRTVTFPFFGGAQDFPSTGGYRFLLCAGVLVLLLRVARDSGVRAPRRWLIAGTVLWLLSLAWSAEAGFYASVVWLPAYALLAWRNARGQVLPWIRLLAWPIAALALTAVAIVAVYAIGLGHPPDLHMYIEYASTYAGGFASLVADQRGPALALLLCLAVLGTLWARSVRRDGLTHPRSVYATGAFFAVWATSSYFATRSHPFNAINLAPVYVIALAGALNLLLDDGASRTRSMLQMLLVPLLAALLIGSFGYLRGDASLVEDPPGNIADVDSIVWTDAGLQSFMRTSGIGRTAPVVLVNAFEASQLPAVDPAAYWLPVAPYGEFALLPEADRTLHLDRFVARTRMSGWLVVANGEQAEAAALERSIASWFVPGRTITDGAWTATYFRYRTRTE